MEWHRLRSRIDQVSNDIEPRRPWRRYAVALAAASVVAVAGYLGVRNTARQVPEWRVVSTPAGGRATLRLEDSTVVTLGPSTTLRYALTLSRRDVALDGLADFRVTHDAARPFRVRARNAVTTDIGTEFVVRAYGSDSAVMVAVTAGAVRLADTSNARAVTLEAGDVGNVSRMGVASQVAGVSATMGQAWMQGSLTFRNQPLGDVVLELDRWFDVDIRIADSVLARKRVTATYASPSLAGVLDAIGATTGARYERNGRVVVMRRGDR
ncbi:MAG: FecR domain-containing protein [Gemmatimonadota bacterium]|nr:FecR domain-containing protein [Gemmatimonadota bacterium]